MLWWRQSVTRIYAIKRKNRHKNVELFKWIVHIFICQQILSDADHKLFAYFCWLIAITKILELLSRISESNFASTSNNFFSVCILLLAVNFCTYGYFRHECFAINFARRCCAIFCYIFLRTFFQRRKVCICLHAIRVFCFIIIFFCVGSDSRSKLRFETFLSCGLKQQTNTTQLPWCKDNLCYGYANNTTTIYTKIMNANEGKI